MKHFSNFKDLPKKTYKHIFFDMDNTLTPSRSPVEESMKEVLDKLCRSRDVIVVSGGEDSRIWKQMTDFFSGKISILGQNGNFGFSRVGKRVWARELSDEEKNVIKSHVNLVEKKFADLISQFRKEEKLLEDRGCQISFSFVGHNSPLADKLKFDPDGKKRIKILEQVPLVSEKIEVKLGGTTCFDYNQKGMNKGYNIKEFAKLFGWNLEDCLYVGDALFPGGNDDTVLGVCDTLQVSSPIETLAAIKKIV